MTGQPVKRRDLNIPAGWKVSHHSTVQVLDHERLAPADLPVRGQWRAIHQSPDGWWLMPADDTARWWMERHGARAGAQSKMISVHSQRLVPGWLQLPLPGMH